MWTHDWRRNLAMVCFGQMLSVAAYGFFNPLLPLFVQSLGSFRATEAVQWAGAMNALGALSMALVQPYWGNLADRLGRKRMVLRSMMGTGATTVLMGLVMSPGQLLAVYVIQGMVTGTVAACTALVAASMPRERLGFGLGMLQVSMFLGSSFGPVGGGLAADAFGFRSAYFVAGGFHLVGACIVGALVREELAARPTFVRSKSTWAESRSLLGIALFPLLVVVIFMIQFAQTIMNPIVSLFVSDISHGESVATSVGMVMGATGAASALSAFVVGRLGDRIGHTPVLLTCLAGCALAYFPQAFVQEVWQFLLLRVALGASLGGLMPSANALVASLIPRERRGAAFGITSASSSLSHAAGPAFGAGVASLWGLREVFLATGVIYGLTFLWAAISFRTQGSPELSKDTSPAAE